MMLKVACPSVMRPLVFALACLVAGTSSLVAGPQVSLTLLDGTTRKGELLSLAPDRIQLTSDAGVQEIPVDSVMQMDFIGEAAAAGEKPAVGVTLADRSSLMLANVESDGTNVTLSIPGQDPVAIPTRQVSDIRFAPIDEKIASRWEDLRSRNARDDLLVIRKGDVLDYVAGSISKITPTAVTMLVREKELSAPREKVFGLVFASRAAPTQARRVAVHRDSGDLLQAETLTLENDQLKITSASLGQISVPTSSLQSLDFGGGRIRFLADLPFDQTASKPPHAESSVVWFVSRNAPSGSGGKAPLTIGTKEFRKGLWLHSGAVVRFRLNREYTQLRATAGFDLTHVTRMPRFDPSVRLVVLGDGQELYSKQFRWNDPPEQLDLKLTDVRELTIRIDSAGSAQGILEHFALGDAQVIQ
ncbi:NPCBM/NEW2 domain-containing protein [Planctomicrobium sp. SH661]|uniref:NPCBM/NEW2 domain-containing protein n=1 Tax=Planctomicrobium sp. SH661 TaxID=3448124 RepID=UPI003F5C3186